ncbi:MAG: cysteine desulfurase family protein [Patescibacteria group bacterium]|nr:cysteine desulfurase [Patescibacteria group bacterium]
MKNNFSVYLDNAATTCVDKEVFKKMKPFFSEKYANPSGPYWHSQVARGVIDKAREQVSKALNASSGKIVFTSCATESINLSHKGLIEALSKKGDQKPHIVVSSIEHSAVLETCRHLEKLCLVEVSYLPVDKTGLVLISDLEKNIRPNTALVSIMYVNNEVGTIEPISEIGKFLKKINKKRELEKKQKIFFHTDATQAIQYLNIDVNFLGVDFLSFTGHKFYAPKGIGALFVKKDTPLSSQIRGGSQEYGLRAGTENVAFIVGLAEAITLVCSQKKSQAERIKKLSQKFIKEALKIKGLNLTGDKIKRVPHIASFLVDGAEGEAMILLLSDAGISASSGSACTSGSLKPSHVLLAMGVPQEKAHGSLRFSLGKDTTEEQINYTLKVLPEIISKVRALAPKGI